MINLRPKTTFVIERHEWTAEDADDLEMLLSHPKSPVLRKLLHRRISDRVEELVNGKQSRDRIDELKDLILELDNYADPK